MLVLLVEGVFEKGRWLLKANRSCGHYRSALMIMENRNAIVLSIIGGLLLIISGWTGVGSGVVVIAVHPWCYCYSGSSTDRAA